MVCFVPIHGFQDINRNICEFVNLHVHALQCTDSHVLYGLSLFALTIENA